MRGGGGGVDGVWLASYHVSFESHIKNRRNCTTATFDLASGLLPGNKVNVVFTVLGHLL